MKVNMRVTYNWELSDYIKLPLREINPTQIKPHAAMATVFDHLADNANNRIEREYCNRLANRQISEVKMAKTKNIKEE